MSNLWKALLPALKVIVGVVSMVGVALPAPPYIIANDDAPFPFTAVSFLALGTNGGLKNEAQVETPGTGIGGGYFGANRILVVNSSTQACVFASEAGSGDVVGI